MFSSTPTTRVSRITATEAAQQRPLSDSHHVTRRASHRALQALFAWARRYVSCVNAGLLFRRQARVLCARLAHECPRRVG